MLPVIRTTILSLVAAALPIAAHAQSAGEQARVTVGAPVYVSHPDDRPGTADWNDGWFNNEGVIVDATWPLYDFSASTRLRGGVVAGVFDNSIYRTSAFVGGVAEVESFVSEKLALSAGTYLGAITGYDYDVAPGLTPYIGASYNITPRFEVGVREFWLPAKTLGGSDVAPSDAFATVITVGTRF